MQENESKKAVEFLLRIIPDGLWVLTGIHPETRQTTTATFSEESAAACEEWIDKVNGVLNIYFSVNQPERGNYGKKLTKEQITEAHFLHVDVDPEKGKELDLQKRQIFDRLTTHRPDNVPRPSVIIDSGGGYQAFWKLETPQPAGTKEQRESVELFNKWIIDQLHGDGACWNIDRIMRLPYTWNIPTDVKKKAGRVEVMSKLVWADEVTYKLTDFSLEGPEPDEGDQDTPKPVKADSGAIAHELEADISGGPQHVEDIEELKAWEVPRRTLHIIVDGEGDNEEKLKKKQAGKEFTRSEWLFDVVCELERRRVPRAIILGVIMEPNVEKFKISESVLEQTTRTPLEYATRQVYNAAKMVAEERLADNETAESMVGLDFEHRQEKLYGLCRGDRPSLTTARSVGEAEELDPLLKALNRFLCVVRSTGGGKPRVVTFSDRPEIGEGKMVMLEKTTFPEFLLQYKGLTVTTGFAKGKEGADTDKPITKPLAEWWLNHRYKNIKERITFAPEKTERELPGVLNEWKGFTYPEEAGGNCRLFLEHMKDNICNGNQGHYDYLLKWCARIYQKPNLVGEVGLFLKGGSGVGKSVFIKILGNLVSTNFFETAQVKKLSNFNSVLRTTVLLFLDEPKLNGEQYDLLKKLMVNDTLDVEAKGYEQETVANCLHIAFASNHGHIAQLDADDRRLFILEVGEQRKGDEDYFNAVYDQLKENDNAGYKALFYFFRNVDLKGFRVQCFPKTEILAEQKELSLTAIEKWLLDRLLDGELIQGSGAWPERIATAAARQDFLDELANTGTKTYSDQDKSKRVFGMFLSKAIGTTAKNAPEGGSGYLVPTLKDSRKNWEKKYGVRVWPEDRNEVTEIDVKDEETELTRGRPVKHEKKDEDLPF
jgi:hypothetical protein